MIKPCLRTSYKFEIDRSLIPDDVIFVNLNLQTPSRRRRAGERGISLTETLVVVGLASVMLTLTGASMWGSYYKQQASAVTRQARSLVAVARMKALKEKVAHRVVFHDSGATTPNTIELQRNQGGSFVTLSDHVYRAPEGVEILGSGFTNSVDSVVAGTRGSCDSGTLYVQGRDHTVRVVTIGGSCHTAES